MRRRAAFEMLTKASQRNAKLRTLAAQIVTAVGGPQSPAALLSPGPDR